MEIDEITKEQNKLRSELYRLLREKTSEFEKTTGVSVSDISVHFENVTSFSDMRPKYVVDGVKVTLALQW